MQPESWHVCAPGSVIQTGRRESKLVCVHSKGFVQRQALFPLFGKTCSLLRLKVGKKRSRVCIGIRSDMRCWTRSKCVVKIAAIKRKKFGNMSRSQDAIFGWLTTKLLDDEQRSPRHRLNDRPRVDGNPLKMAELSWITEW